MLAPAFAIRSTMRARDGNVTSCGASTDTRWWDRTRVPAGTETRPVAGS